MPISRRTLLASMLATGLLPHRAHALDGEPFPVFESDVKEIPYKYRRREVKYKTAEPPGTLVVNVKKRLLFYVEGEGKATRYGISVGKKGKSWSGETVIKRMEKWPVWVPTPEHLAAYPQMAQYIHGMPGGPENPMGARALYLYQGEVDTVYRIHGTIKPELIGKPTTSGCFGLLNVDVIHLYDRVMIGTRVLVQD